jgi:hypothetical protein
VAKKSTVDFSSRASTFDVALARSTSRGRPALDATGTLVRVRMGFS